MEGEGLVINVHKNCRSNYSSLYLLVSVLANPEMVK
jgi:hypothetical protein